MNTQVIQCVKCQKNFKITRDLAEHKRKHHHTVRKSNTSDALSECIYPNCKRPIYSNRSMIDHLFTEHDNDTCKETKQFNTFDEFTTWKENEEIQKRIYFTKHSSRKNIKGVTYHFYLCHYGRPTIKHHRKDEVLQTTNKRNCKEYLKAGEFCPVRLMLKEKVDGRCAVTYYKPQSHIPKVNDNAAVNDSDYKLINGKCDGDKQGKNYTLSIAVPGSILDNAQSIELRTYLAGQIARAAAVFCVQEIVVFDDRCTTSSGDINSEFSGMGRHGDTNVQMAHVLQYLECPQYLRKSFFPWHQNLQYAGLLNPLDSPHHARETEEKPFREGIVSDREIKPGNGSYVDVGISKKFVQIDKVLQPGMRVTVSMHDPISSKNRKLSGKVVSANTPWKDAGIYWGYTVRLARGLREVLTECPFENGYDLTIGTSERGQSVHETTLPEFRHVLVVFGGLDGLESALESEERYSVNDPRELFDLYLNSCPSQGSRTIRTEEAVLITLSALQSKVQGAFSRADK